MGLAVVASTPRTSIVLPDAALAERLAREGRGEMAQAAFDYLPHRARLDLAGWADKDMFSHD